LSLDVIQNRRKLIWNTYYEQLRYLQDKELVQLPQLPTFSTNNAHMFYLVCENLKERTELIQMLKDNNITSVFHYISLHNSSYFEKKHDGRELEQADIYTNCLLRLPLYYELDLDSINRICTVITNYYLRISS
jgi:dTDP-4-amino-4,6-dideoxygalactose transaminase